MNGHEPHVAAATIPDLPDDELSFEPLVLSLFLQNKVCANFVA
jgi:hypothetical protein